MSTVPSGHNSWGTMSLESLSVFNLVQLIWADAMKRSEGHLTSRKMAKLTGIANSTWHKLMTGTGALKPSPKTYMLLAAYLNKSKPPLETEDGFVIPCDWDALQSLDEAYRRSGAMSASEAMAELKKLRDRESELISIIFDIANSPQSLEGGGPQSQRSRTGSPEL